MSGELVDVVKGLEAASEKYGMISHNISKQMREKINGKGPYTFSIIMIFQFMYILYITIMIYFIGLFLKNVFANI